MKDDKCKQEIFEVWWQQNRKQILISNEEYCKIMNSYKMNTGADRLLFAIPVVAAFVVINIGLFRKELLNWVVGAITAIVIFVVSVWIKTLMSGNRSLEVVEKEVKEIMWRKYKDTGSLR